MLFSSCDTYSLQLMMTKLEQYEKVSRQLVNKDKSDFFVSFKDDDPKITNIKRITGFSHCQFPMNYLGCPIYLGILFISIPWWPMWLKGYMVGRVSFYRTEGRLFLLNIFYIPYLYICSLLCTLKTMIYQIGKNYY